MLGKITSSLLSAIVQKRSSIAECTRLATTSFVCPPLQHHTSFRIPPRNQATFPRVQRFNTMTAAIVQRDPSSASNYDVWRTRHLYVKFELNFDQKRLEGRVNYELEALKDQEKDSEIILDASFLAIQKVQLAGEAVKFRQREDAGFLGQPLHITVPFAAKKGQQVQLAIDLATTDKCTALQWLAPEQTSNGKQPYVFSQCQAIHARSILPCQDTPDVKAPIHYELISPLRPVASGVLSDIQPDPTRPDTHKIYTFEQKLPIPSYLVALAAGDLAEAPIGSRSKVATSPDNLEAAKWEFENDMDQFMKAAEKIVFEYPWGEYNVLVLPPSFPYGGMENPVYTFATPTLISGDRENINVVAHELAHSWSGNYASCSSWQHFWLNEGWTVYLERRILEARGKPGEFDFSAIIGWKALEGSVKMFGAEHEYTKLVMNLDGVDPDDSFSSIPYEKGFHFLWFLDRLVGREHFNKFIPHYFRTWANKSLDSFQFKKTFLDFFENYGNKDIVDKIRTIDWDAHFYTPGLPSKPDFDTTLVGECYALVKKWQDSSFTPSKEDLASFTSNQKLVFIEELQSLETPLSADRVQLLADSYEILSSKNVEILSAFYLLALPARLKSVYPLVQSLLGRVGRMKFVRPLFRELNNVDRPLALETFEANRNFYHPICRALVEKDLGL